MSQHYVCPSCGGMSDTEKSCSTAGCALEGVTLKACACQDNKHEAGGLQS